MIYTTVIFNKKNASYFSCVVFLSIVVVHITDENSALFVLNRVLDTITGIIIAFVINNMRIPRKKRKDVLFVSELDSVLLTMKESLTNYSRFQLNKMLDEGANFTIATMRSPAALLEAFDGIRLRLPVVVMDGAMMFDIKEKRCLKLYEMSNKEAMEFINIFKHRNFHCFINVVVEDSVMIYYGEFKNEVEKDIYNKLRVSPYRNYIKFGSIDGVSDAVIEGKDGNEIVKKFNKVYEPYFWKRNVL